MVEREYMFDYPNAKRGTTIYIFDNGLAHIFWANRQRKRDTAIRLLREAVREYSHVCEGRGYEVKNGEIIGRIHHLDRIKK